MAFSISIHVSFTFKAVQKKHPVRNLEALLKPPPAMVQQLNLSCNRSKNSTFYHMKRLGKALPDTKGNSA